MQIINGKPFFDNLDEVIARAKEKVEEDKKRKRKALISDDELVLELKHRDINQEDYEI